MADTTPALDYILAAAAFEPEALHYGPNGGGCYQCPFVAGPAVVSWATAPDQLEPWGNISNDPTEAYYWCHLPTRRRDGQPVALDDAWRVQWGEDGPCSVDEWVAQARAELGR